MKIVTIIGARPQFIKAAAVSRILKEDSEVEEVLVHTGQHYDENMSQVFFDELNIPKPKYNLAIGSSLHGKQTGEMMAAIEEVLLKEKPQWILIYGDTNSTLAGALVGAKLHIPIAHVEAGLRSYNRKMPEEVNRLVADQVSEILFAPTERAVKNLKQEGYADERVQLVGDVMYDVALYYGKKAEAESKILQKLNLHDKAFILVTIHRQENTDHPERLTAIMQSLQTLSKEIPIIFPVHPRTHKMFLQNGLIEKDSANLHFIEPLGFLDMLMLEKNAKLIMTDSGGVQKEAFFCSVPCVTLRDETEWVELVELGWNKLVPPHSANKIVREVKASLTAKEKPGNVFPYGRGDSAIKIASFLKNKFKECR